MMSEFSANGLVFEMGVNQFEGLQQNFRFVEILDYCKATAQEGVSVSMVKNTTQLRLF